MRLPFLAAGSAQPLPITPRPRIIARQSQSSSATAQPGVVRIAARQSQASTGRARPKIVAAQSQASTARGRTRIAAQQSQRTTATAQPPANVWSNGYVYQHEIRLRAWPAGGSSVTNFLLPFSETLTAFKAVANGGEVEHASGYDIRFETVDGTKLGHILIGYNGTTGAVTALVNMPRNFAAAQSIYVYTGKAGLSSSEESASNARVGGWLAWYKGGSGTDLTGQSRTLTANGTPGTTTLLGWPAYDFDGLDDYLGGLAATGFAHGLAALSCVTLAQADAINQSRGLFNIANASASELGLRAKSSGGRLIAAAKYGTSVYADESADNAMTTEPQAVAFVAENGAVLRMAINGAMDTPAVPSGVLSGGSTITDELEWGRGGLGSIGFWNGPAAFLALRSGSMSNAELESMTAALVDPRKVYGIGEANVISSSNRSPVALPVFATGAAGVPVTQNVVASAYDQNSDALTVTDASIASGLGTVTVPNSTDLRVTGNSGVAQTVVSEFGVRDPAGKRSRGRLYATLSASSVIILPAGSGFTELMNATDAASPGSIIMLPNGTYTSAAAVALSRPGIEWQAQNLLGAILNFDLTLSGAGSGVNKMRMGDRKRIVVAGDDNRIIRTHIRHGGGQGRHGILVQQPANRFLVDYCRIQGDLLSTDKQQMGIFFVGGTNPGDGMRAGVNHTVRRTWLHDFPSTAGDDSSGIGIGSGAVNDANLTGILLDRCGFYRCKGDPETISCKDSGVTIQFCTQVDSNAFRNRHGNRNLWLSNWSQNSNGFTCYADRNTYVGNRTNVGPSNVFSIATGTVDCDVWNTPPMGNNNNSKYGSPSGPNLVHPNAQDILLVGNSGKLNVGSEGNPFIVKRVRIEAHTGTKAGVSVSGSPRYAAVTGLDSDLPASPPWASYTPAVLIPEPTGAATDQIGPWAP